MNNIFLHADALEGLRTLEDNSADMCVTSPPYYGLRDYGVEGQIGREATPQEYIDVMVAVFREVKRLLKPNGTLWLNIADTYCGTGSKGNYICPKYKAASENLKKSITTKLHGYKRKDLIGIPWMLALALRDDGWYLRQDIIWYKPNCMPESVKDRCTRSHEYIFLLSKSDRYYFDADAIKEPAVGFDNSPPAGSCGTLKPNQRRRKGNSKTFRGGGASTGNHVRDNSAVAQRESHGNIGNPTGLRNCCDVWSVATKGCKEAHFATFPPKLIEPCILAGSPEGGTVLDPFLGSGTTALVANRLGRRCIGIDIKADYLQIAQKRLSTLEDKVNI